MSERSGDPEAPGRRCSTWAEVVQILEEFPPAEVIIDHEGDVTGTAWVFRGLKSSCYELKPSVEREAQSKSMAWRALEVRLSARIRENGQMLGIQGVAGLRGCIVRRGAGLTNTVSPSSLGFWLLWSGANRRTGTDKGY